METTKVGIPLGQLPKAFVVRKDDSLTEAAVKEHIEKLTTRYKWLAEGKEKIPKVGSRALRSLRFCKSTVLFLETLPDLQQLFGIHRNSDTFCENIGRK